MTTPPGQLPVLSENAMRSRQGTMLAREAHFDKSAQPALRRLPSARASRDIRTCRRTDATNGCCRRVLPRYPARDLARTRSRLTPPPSAASTVAVTIAARAPSSP